MARPRFTTDGCRDLEDIVRYIGARDPGAATRLTDRLETECWRLTRDSGIGQLRPDLATGLRFFRVGHYLIFYRDFAEPFAFPRPFRANYMSSDCANPTQKRTIMKLIPILLTLLFLTPAFGLESADEALPLVRALTSSNWSWENTDGGK